MFIHSELCIFFYDANSKWDGASLLDQRQKELTVSWAAWGKAWPAVEGGDPSLCSALVRLHQGTGTSAGLPVQEGQRLAGTSPATDPVWAGGRDRWTQSYPSQPQQFGDSVEILLNPK